MDAREPTLYQGGAAVTRYEFVSRLADFPFVDAIYLFGSRARGESAPRADIDLAVVAPLADEQAWDVVMEIVEDADTLLRIDCVRLDALASDDPLRLAIERDKVALSRREPRVSLTTLGGI